MANDTKAYLGNDPYIFISYAHKDQDKVFPFIQSLQKKYNVWFDEGLHYGKEWDEEIVERLSKCSLFIFMVTSNSLKSINCRDELTLAREKGVIFINICVEKSINFPDWFDFRFGRFQRCNLYSFQTCDDAITDLSNKCNWFQNVVKNSLNFLDKEHITRKDKLFVGTENLIGLENVKNTQNSDKASEVLESLKITNEKFEELKRIRERLAVVKHHISIYGNHIIGLDINGTVFATTHNKINNYYGQCDVSNWKNICAISTGYYHSIGLKTDGTVIATKYLGKDNYCGQCDVSDWKSIVEISAGGLHSLGLKSDGAVVASNYIGVATKTFAGEYEGQCDVSNWKDIIAISAGSCHSLGLKANGTVIACGSNKNGQCDVSNWKDIVAISAGAHHSLGLKADGTVVATGYIMGFTNGIRLHKEECDVSNWKDIVAIAAGTNHSIGLKSDGTVVACGDNSSGQCCVGGLENIVAIAAGTNHSIVLKSDGTIKVCNYKDASVLEMVCGWKLFNSFENLEKEKTYTRNNRCRYCGGELVGALIKRCVKCGRRKDY